MVFFRALISAFLFTSLECARVSLEGHADLTEGVEDNQPWNFQSPLNTLAINPNPRGPLIPGLVPPPGTSYEVVNREMELGIGGSHNSYRWAFLSINQNGQSQPVNEWFASINGEGLFGFLSGTRRTMVRNNVGVELFAIEAARRSTTTSWRIRHPASNQILFTINKDFFGTGFLGLRDEWRIYRGRMHDAQPLYYVVADYSQHNHKFYHNRDEYMNEATPAAESRNYAPGGMYTQGFVSDSIGATIQAGEDTALVLSATVVIDMLNEIRAENARRREALRIEEEETGHRRRRGAGSSGDVRRRRGSTRRRV